MASQYIDLPVVGGGGGASIGGAVTGGVQYKVLYINPAATLAQTNILPDSSGGNSIDFWNRQLYDSAHVLSEDYQNRTLNDTTGIISLDFANRQAKDLSGVIAVDWMNRIQLDSTGNNSIGWDNRNLFDSTNNPSIDYGNRRIFDPTPASIMDWSTIGTINLTNLWTIPGYSGNTFAWQIGTSSAAQNSGIAPTQFYGATANNFLGDPDKWALIVIQGVEYRIPAYL